MSRGLLCYSLSVNLTHWEQPGICCLLTKHRMSAGVSFWLVSQNIIAPSRAMKSASAQSFYHSPLWTKGTWERAVHFLGFVFQKCNKKEDGSLLMNYAAWKRAEKVVILTVEISPQLLFFLSPLQAEVLSRNQRYLWGGADWESGSLGFCGGFTEVILQLF